MSSASSRTSATPASLPRSARCAPARGTDVEADDDGVGGGGQGDVGLGDAAHGRVHDVDAHLGLVHLVEGHMASLRRFKDDVKSVKQGYECGIGIEKFQDLKVGDTIGSAS